jgi:hypothetical protein
LISLRIVYRNPGEKARKSITFAGKEKSFFGGNLYTKISGKGIM